MTIFEFLIMLAIAGVCGAIGQAIAGVSSRGCLASIGLGFIGALIGRVVADKFGLPTLFDIDVEGHEFPVVWSILFSAVFVALVSFLTKRPAKT
jgi:uncharacterized membrane protein YeaQ/YmgE (transglycosylase-associated protein family)